MKSATPNPNRDRFRALVAQVAKMTDTQRAALAAGMPIVTCEGRTLSIHNTCLLLSQSETPLTVVGGFRQWLAHGRAVKKGEHGLMIWFPRTPKADPNRQPGGSSDTPEETRFLMGYVFDISQTQEIETPERVQAPDPRLYQLVADDARFERENPV